MWKCKRCGEKVFKIEIDEIRTKYSLDKNKENDTYVGSCNKKPRYIFECYWCENKSDKLEDIAEWEED